jgi:hypothetical protein
LYQIKEALLDGWGTFMDDLTQLIKFLLDGGELLW